MVYLTDVSRVADMNAAYRESFPGALPARATIGPGLVSPTALVEIMVVASRDAKPVR
jgi:enamine deaminase RidA (YjgF/YER057c/UK114 family)